MTKELLTEVGSPDFCRNFPSKPEKILARDNIFEHLNTVFRDAAQCILVEGEVQSGKTELLANFMRRNPNTSVGVFLSPGDTYFYSPEYARLVLSEQINWLINGVSGNFDSIDEASYKKLLYQLQKVARKIPITFVIDGISGKSPHEHGVVTDILKLLPFSQNDFRFLISGTDALEDIIKSKCKSFKSVPLIPIAQEEAAEYFSDTQASSPKDISDIRKFCDGSIGRMSKLKSILKTSGLSLDEILDKGKGDIKDLMEISWDCQNYNDNQEKCLALLCFANRQLSLELISLRLDFAISELADFLEKCSFVDVNSNSKLVCINSNAQKEFLQTKLSKYSDFSQQLLLDELLRNPESIDADRYLPVQLMQTGKNEDLIKRLDVSHFCRLLSNEKSLRVLKSHFDLGITAAINVNDENAFSQFGMGKSVIGGIALSNGSHSRVEALVAIGLIDEAIALSLAAPTKEEQLRHLAATARVLFEERKSIPQSVRADISNLLKEVTADTLGNLAIIIACDLISFDLEAAVKLFNSANSLVKNEKTKASTPNQEGVAERAIEESSVSRGKDFEILISEKHHYRFAESLGQIVDRTSAEKICARVKNSSDYASDLLFLKEWISRRYADPQAHEVANAAIDTLLKDLTRSPRIEDLRAIGSVLPYISDVSIADKISKRLQALTTTELFLGNSVEAVRLKMLILEVKHRQFPQEAELDLLDSCFEIEKISDLSMRLTCFSWMLFYLKNFSKNGELESRTSLISHITQEILNTISALLKSSADHFGVVRTALPALARVNAELAIEVCASLNTESRRDAAYSMLFKEMFIIKSYLDNPKNIICCIDRIHDESIRSHSILTALSIVVSHLKVQQANNCNDAVLNLWKRLRLPNYRFIGLRYAIQISFLTKLSTERIDKLKKALSDCWNAVDIDWVRWELGYSLVRDINAFDSNYANQWLAMLSEEEKSIRAPSESVNEAIKIIASVAVRAYSYLSPAEFEQSIDFDKLRLLIDAMAVPDEKMLMWCELGIRLHFAEKEKFSKYICQKFVEPLLLSSRSTDGEWVFSNDLTLTHAAPFLYITHEATGQLAVEKISDSVRRDIAISDICFTLLRRVAITDAFKEADDDAYEMDDKTASSILSLLAKMTTDWAIFRVLKAFVRSISAKRNESKIRRVQAADFLESVESLVSRALPDQKNIRHEGFLISSLAVINRARHIIGLSTSHKVWPDLYKRARSLDNVSDRAVVTAFVVVGARARKNQIAEDWFEQIKDDISAAPTVLDQIDRYSWVAEILESLDKKQSIAMARLGMTMANNVEADIDIYERKRKILDLVFSIDPDIAEDFIEISDKDRARKNDKAALEARLRLQRLQRDAAAKLDKIQLTNESDLDIAELSMRNLAALNANKISPRPVEDFKQLNEKSNGLPLESAYGIWSWTLENAIKRGGSQSKGEKAVNRFFNASIKSGELLISLLSGEAKGLNPGGFRNGGVVLPGDRDAAISKIIGWASTVDGEDILISDPYFGPEDLDLIFELTKAAPRSFLRILTGKRHLKGIIQDGNFEQGFSDVWRSICDTTGNDIEVSIIGVNADGDHPIHDRWLVSKNSGVRIGTSTKSLGNFRVSEVTEINIEQSEERFDLIESFINRKTRTWEGVKLNLSSFALT